MKLELPKQNNHKIAFENGAKLLREGDIPQILNRTGAKADGDLIKVSYFTREVAIAIPEVRFLTEGVSLLEQIFILHYLTTPGSHPVKGEMVQFKNLPGASFYEIPYRRRGTNLILAKFKSAGETLVKAGLSLGGEKAAFGDFSVTVPVLPKITATPVLFLEDDEFPPEAVILYQDDIINFLAPYDITILSSMLYKHLKMVL